MSKADSPTKLCQPHLDLGERRAMRASVDGVPMCGTHYNRARYTPEQRHPKVSVPCGWCGKPCPKDKGREKKYAGLFCSYACRDTWRRRDKLPVLFVGTVVRPAPERPALNQRATRLFVGGTCVRCGATYLAEDYTDTARYCSVRCGKRVNKQRYRARKKEAYVADVSPSRIYERDGWRCQLCRRKVQRDKAVPHPLAPVLDHIIPLAAGVENGGVHAPHNTQCAHFICNSIKRDQVAGAVQLSLM